MKDSRVASGFKAREYLDIPQIFVLLNETREGFDQGMRGDYGFDFGPKNTKNMEKGLCSNFSAVNRGCQGAIHYSSEDLWAQ